jgi:hypothetical protein
MINCASQPLKHSENISRNIIIVDETHQEVCILDLLAKKKAILNTRPHTLSLYMYVDMPVPI